jgi:hypothetical protein
LASAKQMSDPEDRAAFQNLAAYWTRMAKEAGREAMKEKTG